MTIDSIRQQTIRCHLRQKNIGLALKVFLSIPNVETHSHALLEAILRDWYLAGLLETQTLLEFFSELPDAQWTLDGLEIVYTLIEMLSQAGDFRAMVQIQSRCPLLPIARFLERFRLTLRGSERLRADQYWNEWVSDTVRHILKGTQFHLLSVPRAELMYAPLDSLVFDNHRRRVFTWMPKPFIVQEGSKQETWSIIPVNQVGDRYLIRSEQTCEYLYATDWNRPQNDTMGRAQSHVFLWRDVNNPTKSHDEKYFWQLIPVSQARRDVFALYNCHVEEFLYGPDEFHDKTRRNVTTTAHNEDASWLQDRQWQLIPQD